MTRKSPFQILKYRSGALTICVFLLFPLSLAASPTGDIQVNIDNIEKRAGNFLVNLYDDEKGFPGKPEHAIRKLVIKFDAEKPQAVFESVPHGIYAVAVCHDVNTNNECDTNFMGIPQEQVGVSNNAKGFMGPPKYKDAKFALNTDKRELHISLD